MLLAIIFVMPRVFATLRYMPAAADVLSPDAILLSDMLMSMPPMFIIFACPARYAIRCSP